MIDIDKILLEWAMMSDDGLLSGRSAENILVLKKVLAENNIPESMCDEIVSSLNGNVDEKKKPVVPDVDINSIKPDEPSENALRHLKKIKEHVNTILKLAADHPVLHDKYNNIQTMEDLMNFVNDPANSSFVKPFSELKGSTLGEGELLLVYLMKGAVSGGTNSGDIILESGEKIDVKKIIGWKFRVELASFNGYSSSEFNAAISELIYFSADKKNAEVLKKLVDATDDKNISQSAYYAYKFKESTKRFFESPDVELLRRGAVMGLLGMSAHISSMDPGDPATDYADFVIDQDKTTVNLNNSKDVQSVIKKQGTKGPDAKPEDVTITVSPIDDEEVQLIIPRIKKLKYFKDRFGPENISKNLLPKLHYQSIIFYNTDNGKQEYTYMTKKDIVDSFDFYGWAKAPEFIMNDTVRPPESYRGGKAD
jgi:hypothetical protein